MKNPLLLLFILSSVIAPLPTWARGDSEEEIPNNSTHYSAIIKIDSESSIDSLKKEGVEILRRRDNLLLCFIPRSPKTRGESTQQRDLFDNRQENLSRIKGVTKIEPGRKTTFSMDKAKQWFEAESLHTGENFPSPYTGAGVVTGICDIGIDPLHIAFLDENGDPRIKRIVQYKEGSGERIVLNSKEEYQEWETDTPDNWHASHVANIMAGSYGIYKGMAPDSEIVITTSQLTDVGLLCGAEDILEYANETGKRAVINMSMANYLGPHDGTSLFCQYLDKIAEEAVVVLSAGNGGRTNFTLPFDFTEENVSAGLPLYSSDWVQFDPYGAVEVWSRDKTPLRVRFGIQNAEIKEIVKMYPWQEITDGSYFVITSDPNAIAGSDKETVIYDPDFAGIYSGYFALSGGIYSENGRYCATLEYDAHTDIVSAHGPWAKYVPVIEVSGDPGTHADIYADFQYTNFRTLPGGPEPGSLLSFSDLATGENVISVGMFVNRDKRPLLSGGEVQESYPAGTIAPMSSYSTLIDGRIMPHTVAPGFGVISAISNHYREVADGTYEFANAESVVGGNHYYWVTNSGTSMSAPYVAGTLACWLEALPSLTSSQIINIITDTNRLDYPEPENPRHGRGWFNPIEGLRAAFKSFSGIGNMEDGDCSSADKMRLTFDGKRLSLWNPQKIKADVVISDLTGSKKHSISSEDNLTDIDLSMLSKGIYIAHIPGTGISLKFII
ncbi:MAG: S8 family peptidase [Muribaculaceae bacterium]|nr:S8 family peptidase [Muribaculaceae bacterium]